MHWIKRNTLFLGSIILGVISIQVTYIVSQYHKDMQCIKENTRRIDTMHTQIAHLTKQLQQLPKIEEQNKVIHNKQQAIMNKLPIASTKQMIALYEYMNLNGFFNVELVEVETLEIEEDIIKKEYILSFISQYEDVRLFVEKLNEGTQLVHIHHLVIDNSIQSKEDPETLQSMQAYFGENLEQVVSTQIQFAIYTRKSKDTKREMDQADLKGKGENQMPFKEPWCKEEVTQETSTTVPLKKENHEVSLVAPEKENAEQKIEEQQEAISQPSAFEIYIGDILTAGDTYQFIGPGGKDTYMGFVSKENVYMILSLDEKGYTISMKEANGQVKKATYEATLYKPQLMIVSTMRPLETTLPTVHIYIYNETTDEVVIEGAGSLPENIHIYNKFQEELVAGQVKGKVKLL